MDVDSPEAVLWSENMSLKSQNEYLRSVLCDIIDLDHHNHGPKSRATAIAVEALNKSAKPA
jgi:hypothetical protein